MSFSSFCNLGIVLPANCWQTDVRQVPWKRPGQGRLQIPNSLWGDKYQRGNKTSRKPKVNAEIQIPQEEKKKSLSMSLYSPRIFVQEWMFHQLEFGTLFYNHVPCTEHCPWRHLSPPPRKDKWCKHLPGDPACSPPYKMSQQKHKKLLLHFKSGVSDASGWTAQEKSELWGINSPIFLQEIFVWQSNLPMRLQVGNKPEKHQHLGIWAVLV